MFQLMPTAIRASEGKIASRGSNTMILEGYFGRIIELLALDVVMTSLANVCKVGGRTFHGQNCSCARLGKRSIMIPKIPTTLVWTPKKTLASRGASVLPMTSVSFRCHL